MPTVRPAVERAWSGHALCALLDYASCHNDIVDVGVVAELSVSEEQ